MEEKVTIVFVVQLFHRMLSTGLPPTFRRTLVNQEAMEGNSVTLHCELSKAASSVEWRRGGELLRHGDKYQARKKELQAEMKILDLSASDGGEYSCVCGEQTTRAVITVKGECLHASVYAPRHICGHFLAVYSGLLLGFFPERPIKFLQELTNIQVQEGNEVKLRCEISKAGAPIEWKKGEKALSDGEKYQMKQSGSMLELVIRKSQPEDSGTYSCVCAEVKSSATVIITGESHHVKLVSVYRNSPQLIAFTRPRQQSPSLSSKS